MIWLTWRQHRLAALTVAVTLGALGAFILLTGLPMRDAFAADGRQIWGKSVTGALGVLLEPTRGLPVLDLNCILALVNAS